MRKSKVLKKLRAGQIVTCFNVHLDAQASEIAAMAGFDCLWIDREHLAQDWSSLREHIWAAKSHDVDVMVRVSKGSYSDYIKPLELDASGIMVPHLMSIDEAKEIVHMTRFHPLGRRPLDGGNADGGYGSYDYKSYTKHANKERFVIVQIEDPEALEHLEAIAATDGIDMLFFGPGDFSQGIGTPGKWDNPELLEARNRVAEVAKSHGKYAGIPGSLESLDELIELGYRFIVLGADVITIGQYCDKVITKFHEIIRSKIEDNLP